MKTLDEFLDEIEKNNCFMSCACHPMLHDASKIIRLFRIVLQDNCERKTKRFVNEQISILLNEGDGE